jgi:probable F420-dependent oxidoreductase
VETKKENVMTSSGIEAARSTALRESFGDGRLRVGLALTPSSQTVHPAVLARIAEERGFAAIFCSEHTHIPVSRVTPYPGGGVFPEAYKYSIDPLTWLTVAATASTNLWLGTGVALIAQHDPIALAKQIASVDLFSGGRLIIGFGFGWNIDECEDHGIDPRSRRAVAREHMLTMQRLWEDDEAEFHGKYVNLSSSWAWPKPVQSPYPPILLGAAAGEKNFSHLLEYCDGWLVNSTIRAEDIADLRQRAETVGRDPSSIRVAVHRAHPNRENLEQIRDAGADFLSLSIPDGGPDDALAAVDQYTTLVEEVLS